MTWTKTIAYWVVALLLGGYYFALQGGGAPVAEEVASHRQKVLDIFVDEVEAIEVRREGRVVRAERNPEGRWKVVAPEGVVVPSDLLSALLSTLADKQEGEIVSEKASEGDLEAFGLAPPAQKIALELTSGRKVLAEVGTRNPTRTAVYARREGSREVVLAGLNVQYYSDLLVQAAYPGGTTKEN